MVEYFQDFISKILNRPHKVITHQRGESMLDFDRVKNKQTTFNALVTGLSVADLLDERNGRPD
jgi:hypothetical protein